MQSQNVNKVQLLEILKTNRDKHKAIFDEAVTGYQKKAEELLKDHLKRVRSGERVRVHISLPYPVNQTKDYDRVIGMLEMSMSSEVELDEQDYQQYVMDDWSWKGSFLASNAMYSQTATAALGGE
jgi:hypothetical protein